MCHLSITNVLSENHCTVLYACFIRKSDSADSFQELWISFVESYILILIRDFSVHFTFGPVKWGKFATNVNLGNCAFNYHQNI